MSDAHEMNHEGHTCCGLGYASPQEAMKAEREKVLYTVALYVGTGVEQPDYPDLLTNPAKHGCRHDERDSKAPKISQ